VAISRGAEAARGNTAGASRDEGRSLRCENLGNGAVFRASGNQNRGRKNSVAIRREFLRGVAIRFAAGGKSGVFSAIQAGFIETPSGGADADFLPRGGAHAECWQCFLGLPAVAHRQTNCRRNLRRWKGVEQKLAPEREGERAFWISGRSGAFKRCGDPNSGVERKLALERGGGKRFYERIARGTWMTTRALG